MSLLSWLVQTSYLLLSQHGYGHVVLPPAVTEGAALMDEGFKTEGGPDMAEKAWGDEWTL